MSVKLFFKAIILSLVFLNISTSQNSIQSLYTTPNNIKRTTSALLAFDNNQQWENLCKLMAQMMLNGDSSVNKDEVRVAVYIVGSKTISLVYEGFYQMLLKYGQYKITLNVYGTSFVSANYKDEDFVIFLIDEFAHDYENFIPDFFDEIIQDKSRKIFVILSSYTSARNFEIALNVLFSKKCYNVYAINHEKSGLFAIVRIVIRKTVSNALKVHYQETKDKKFLMMKDVLKGDEVPFVRVIFFDSYPMSYAENGVIIGAEGNLINVFCKKRKIAYKIMNSAKRKPKFEELYNYLDQMGDISLYTNVNINSKNLKVIYINQMLGLCLLVPRNIPVSAYENFSFPLDRASMIMAFVSTISVIICWRLVTNEMSITAIIFAVYELILNLGASGIERITLRETFLVYCFIFSSFILVSFYESIFLSFMFATPTWRSASSLEELNDSNTMFYSFYDGVTARHNNFPRIRPEKILNFINFIETLSIEIPDYYDENLVYTIFCDYAEYFILSSRNYKGVFFILTNSRKWLRS
ncbi:hypothetical protein ACKWTF_000698 [Chironomus riparius]